MTLHRVSEQDQSGQPPQEGVSESPVSVVLSAISDLLSESALAHEQFLQARHDQATAEQFDAGAERSGKEAAETKARAVAERHKAGSYRQVNRAVGTALAIALAFLDALPAYWSAQAFGLDQVSTLILAVLLCAALGGAMWLLDLFVDKRRKVAARILGCALGAGFVGMFVLRLNYLTVTAGSAVGSAAIQALALTGLSAALVAVGFVLLSHRVPKAVASAELVARRADRLHDRHMADELHAKAAMSRAAFTDTVLTWVLAHGRANVGYEQSLRAINGAIDVLLGR